MLYNMKILGDRLKDLMEENNIDAKQIAAQLDLSNTSAVYKWMNGRKSILLNNAIELADLFGCSLDYLFGRTDNYNTEKYKLCPPFNEQLKAVLQQRNSSQNKLIKFAKVNPHSLNNWLNGKSIPHIESAIKIADYLDITLDYLVGRES